MRTCISSTTAWPVSIDMPLSGILRNVVFLTNLLILIFKHIHDYNVKDTLNKNMVYQSIALPVRV